LLREILEQGYTILHFTREQRQLNEAFLDLTQQGVRS